MYSARFAFRVTGVDAHKVVSASGALLVFDDSIPYKECWQHDNAGADCAHPVRKDVLLSGAQWNADHLDITLESLRRDQLGVLESQDLKKVNESTLWKAVKGSMPRNGLALYVPLSQQKREVRMLVNNETMRGFQDFTATLRIQYTSEEHPPYVLPGWVSGVVILLPGGNEIPLPDGYTMNLERVFMSVGKQTNTGKGSVGNAFTQIAAQCVCTIPVPPSYSTHGS